MTSDTSTRAPKSSGAIPIVRLSRMLQSMLRRYPSGRLQTTKDGFGVSLDAATSIRVSYSGHWSDQDMRDWLVLFALWLVADPSRLRQGGEALAGVLQMAVRESELSSSREA